VGNRLEPNVRLLFVSLRASDVRISFLKALKKAILFWFFVNVAIRKSIRNRYFSTRRFTTVNCREYTPAKRPNTLDVLEPTVQSVPLRSARVVLNCFLSFERPRAYHSPRASNQSTPTTVIFRFVPPPHTIPPCTKSFSVYSIRSSVARIRTRKTIIVYARPFFDVIVAFNGSADIARDSTNNR